MPRIRVKTPSPDTRYLVVDGHSMIFAWEDLRALHERNASLAREELVRRLTAYQDGAGERVVLVFDGNHGPDEEAAPRIEDIQIIYSRAGGSADAVIERLAGKYASDFNMTVASRDRAVLDAVAAFGAHGLSAIALRERLADEERRFRALLHRRKP